jgi:hypothetical protein
MPKKAPGCQPCGDTVQALRTPWFGVAVGDKIQGACRGHLGYITERVLIQEPPGEVKVEVYFLGYISSTGEIGEEEDDAAPPVDS